MYFKLNQGILNKLFYFLELMVAEMAMNFSSDLEMSVDGLSSAAI